MWSRRPARPAAILFTSLAAALAVHAPGHAQNALPPEAAQAIDAVFADIDAAGPGCAVGVVAGRELVYGKGFGMANLDYGLPITTRSNFYLGSIGKQFTAAAVVHAARAGHLSLDDDVRRWIPELPEYERPITLRHLIHHTSGIRDYLTLGNLAGWSFEAPHTVEEILGLIARQRATNFPPGDEYLYSNSGYFLLAEVVKRATGMSLRAYAEAELLGPLGMTRTRIHDDRREPLPDRVVGYELEEGEVRLDHPWNFDQVGSGGVYSSIEELVHWDRNFYTEEAGGAGFTAQLLGRGVLTSGDTIPYAFGLVHGEYRGLATVAHGGSLAGFRAHLLRFPEQETTALVLCNFPTSDPGDRARKVADAVLADRLAPVAAGGDEGGDEVGAKAAPAEPVKLSAEQLDAFVGHWRASIGVEVEIRRDGDGLVFVQGSNRAPLTIVSESELRLEAADITMTYSDLRDGRYHFQDVVQRGQTFTAKRFDPDAPPDRDYTALLGAYHSDELDATYRLVEGERGLALETPPDREVRAVLLDDGRVRTPFGFLRLEHRDGRVVAFTVDAGRARGIRFERVAATQQP